MMTTRPLPATSSSIQAIQQVTTLVSRLQNDLTEKKLSAQQRQGLLEQLKVLGRNPTNSEAIYAREGIETLSRYALDTEPLSVSREALRCLANAFLLQEQTRKLFVDLGYIEKAADRLQNDDRDDEFLVSRILFLMTYSTSLDFRKLIDEHRLADSINQACPENNIARHGKRYSKTARRSSSPHPMEEMSLVETLKLVFNTIHYHPDLAPKFSDSTPHLFKILSRIQLPSPPLQPPVNFIVNALMNLDLSQGSSEVFNPVFPTFKEETNIERLIYILDRAIQTYSERELDSAVAPLMTLLRRIYENAPPQMQQHMRKLLLPTDESRNNPLGKDETLASRLLRLSVSPMLPTLRENISALFFELSDKDASRFVKNIGYGYASGFLMNHNIEVPESAAEASSTEGTGTSDINPVTGQRRDKEKMDTEPPMSDEEKEREAERLFVLFERLRATGVVDVQNPVRQAMEEGRFEELDD